MTAGRFPRTVRLDASDDHVFERAAGADEWAVSGGFAFMGADPETMSAKARQAFHRGFLGLSSFGRATFVRVAEIDDAGYEEVVMTLARHAVSCYGAPSIEAALPAAREEAAFAQGLCEHKLNSLLIVEREMGDDGIVERFRVVQPPREADHARIWSIVEDEASESSERE